MTASTPSHDVAGRTVLVTGGAGFVGSHLARALLPDNEVVVLDDLSTGSRAAVPDGARLVVGDVRDRPLVASLVAAADLVFHQAAVVSVERSVTAPAETHAVNATATLGLLEAARGASTRVVLASSAAVYGRPESVPQSEDDRLAPESPYGVAKLAADRYARVYTSLYGVPTVSLRYFNVYGPRPDAGGDGGVVEQFLERARAGEPIPVHGDGSQTRDFVHVRDVVRANLAAATTDRVGRAFNVGTGESLSIADLAGLVAAAADREVRVVHTEAREGDVDHSRADTTATRELLGFEATVPPEEGLGGLLD